MILSLYLSVVTRYMQLSLKYDSRRNCYCFRGVNKSVFLVDRWMRFYFRNQAQGTAGVCDPIKGRDSPHLCILCAVKFMKMQREDVRKVAIV